MLGRLQRAWRELEGEQRMAGFAAIALLISLTLPWYQATVIDRGRATNPTFSAFGVFSFVEAAILLVALGVFVLLFARGERRGFHLPGGDGTVIFAAGAWAAVLLLWRVFDRPNIDRAVSDGITWGFFFAFLAAIGLAFAGAKLRAAHRPEPPIVRADDEADYGPRTAATKVAPRRRRPAAPTPSEQLTLDDAEAPTRHVPREPEPEPEPPRRATPPPIRPGVFDVEDAPLRPGEIPRRTRDD